MRTKCASISLFLAVLLCPGTNYHYRQLRTQLSINSVMNGEFTGTVTHTILTIIQMNYFLFIWHVLYTKQFT